MKTKHCCNKQELLQATLDWLIVLCAISEHPIDVEHFPYQLANIVKLKLKPMLENVKQLLHTKSDNKTTKCKRSRVPKKEAFYDLNVAAVVLYALIHDWSKDSALLCDWPQAEKTIKEQYNNICNALDTLSF